MLLALALAGALGRAGAAHPMGNFAICHYTALEVKPGALQVRCRLDMAEIPAFSEKRLVDADGNGSVSEEEKRAYLGRKGPELARGLSVMVDGKAAPLELSLSDLAFSPGAGGLPTLKIDLRGTAALPRDGVSHAITYEDRNYAERTGWKEIIATAGEGARLERSSVPAADRSRALTLYPTDPTVNPPQDVRAEITFRGGGSGTAALAGPPAPGTPAAPARTRDDAFTRLIYQDRLPAHLLLIALLTAFVLGAGHALSPGHGKTMVAAYLVGSRGTAAHAALLGVTVTVSHTAGVFLLGLVSLFLSRSILPERLYPWLGFLSGGTIALIGLRLLVLRLRGLEDRFDGHSHAGPHGHSHHPSHEHNHSHAHARAHSHGAAETRSQARTEHGPPHDHPLAYLEAGDASPPDSDGRDRAPGPVSVGSLIGLGISGGIVPCPSALVVLLSAVALHRIGLGLLLIVAFSAGLASVLVLIGLLVVQGRRLMERVPWQGPKAPWLLRRLPIFSAGAVCLLGTAIALQSLSGAGLVRPSRPPVPVSPLSGRTP
jgi:ABC-type nickel/cobalt efflux system permease component RcnA